MIEKLREIKKELEVMAEAEYNNDNTGDELLEEIEKAITHIRRAIIEINNKK